VELQINTQKKSSLNNFWNMGGNTCHVSLWFRSDLQNHLKIVKEELGFKYIRAHGILNDEMDIIQEDGSFSFKKVIEALEIIKGIGLYPFVELSSMPKELASNETFITHYPFRSAPPADWGEWSRLVKEFMLAIYTHFGEKELMDWYFEVWNEPDIHFWQGTMDEYFKLYDLAYKAVKDVCVDLKVGGPATARTSWVSEFTEHMASDNNGADCDFLSTHAYPSDIAFVDSDKGDVELCNSNIMKHLFCEVRKNVNRNLSADIPVIIGEWNSSAGPLAFNHDDANNAPYIVKTMLDLMPYCQGSLYWNISDIYEECGFHSEPFHGGYGLITVNDLRKASFHAFKMLNSHTGEIIEHSFSDQIEDSLGALVTQDDDEIKVLIYYYQEPDSSSSPSVNISITGLSEEIEEIEEISLSAGRGSAYETWLEMKKPSYVNREILRTLDVASHPEVNVYKEFRSSYQIKPASLLQFNIKLKQ